MTATPSTVAITYTTRLPRHPAVYSDIAVWMFNVGPNVVTFEVALPRIGQAPTRLTENDLLTDGLWPSWLPRPDLEAVRRAARIILGDDLALDAARVVLATDPHDPVAELQAFREIRDLVTRIEDCRLCGAAGWLDARNKPASRQLFEVECPDCHGVGKRRVAS